MSPGSTSLCLTLLFVAFVCADEKFITAKSGQDVTLTCRAPNNNIIVLKWSRDDLGEKYVLLYRDGHFDPDNQHPSFKNRVDLQDRQMKDGNMSLILKDVTINDAGRYVCGVFIKGQQSWKPITSSYLRVISPDPKILKAKSGQNVTLTCRAPSNKIRVLKWRRADLKQGYVLLYRDGHFDQANQHPSFKNRVDLQDRQMKDGDVSLILKDVTINDAGTYECRVFMAETRSWKPISSIYLRVVPLPGQSGGDTEYGGNRGRPEWSIGLIVFLGVVVVVVVVIYKNIQQWKIKHRKQFGRSAGFSKLDSESPPAVPRSQSCPKRRKKDDQGQKQTDDADLRLQSPV